MNKEEKRKPTIEKKRYTVFHMNQYKKTIFCFAPLATLLLLSLFAFTITASATVTPTIDLKASSDTGVSDTDDLTNDNTPTFTVAGFPDDALITVTATTGGVKDLQTSRYFRFHHHTGTRTGNGDVTLDMGTISHGTWSVSASDGTITAPPITIRMQTTKPKIHGVSSIGMTTDTTPDLTFQNIGSREGVLVANSACGITAQEVEGHSSLTITLTELAPATYASCTIQMTDKAGNTSLPTNIPLFIIYTTVEGKTPTIDLKASSDTGVSDTDDLTNDNTPTFTVAGFPDDALITVTATTGGVKDLQTSRYFRFHHHTGTRTGNGDVTLDMGTISHGTWSVSASDGTITAPPITIRMQTTKPKIHGVSSIGMTTDTTPDLTFQNIGSREGVLVANSACGITAQEVEGHSSLTITLTELAPATYASCTIQMTDKAGNTSLPTNIPLFIIYTTVEGKTPTIDLKASSDTGVSDTDDLTNDNTPTFTVAGFPDDALITVTATTGGVKDLQTSRYFRFHHHTGTRTGNGDVTLDMGTISHGTWSVSASDGTITAPPITIRMQTTKPKIHGVSSIGMTTDTTPDLTFQNIGSREGVLVANSACGITAQEVEGHSSLTITLTELAPATYASCTIQMTDKAGNTSLPTNIPLFIIYTTPAPINAKEKITPTTPEPVISDPILPSVETTTDTLSVETLASEEEVVTPTTVHSCSLGRVHDHIVFAGDTFTVDLSDYSSDFEHFCNGYTFAITANGHGTWSGETISVVHETPSSPVITISTTLPEGGYGSTVDNGLIKIKVIAPDLSVRHRAFAIFSDSPTYKSARTRTRNNIPKCEQTTKKPIKDHILLVGETTIIDLTEHFSQHFTHDECKTETVFHKSITSEHFTAVLDGTTLSLTGVSKGAGEAVITLEEDEYFIYGFPFSVTVQAPTTPEPVISDPILPTVETITTDTLSVDTLASECNTKTQKVKTQRILVGYTEKINLSDHFSSDLCSLTFSVKTTDKVDAEVKGGDKLLLTANKESRSKVTVVAQGANSAMTQTFRVKAYNLPAVDTLTDKQRFIVRKITEHNSKNNYLLVTFWRRAFFDLVGKKEVKIKRAKTEKGTKEYKSLSTLLWHLKQ